MQKDQYAMLKARQEIVKAFIDKLESASMNDVSIIPALMDYIQTGNREMFDDYRMYLETTTIEERIRKAEAAAAEVEERAKEKADDLEQMVEWHEARAKQAEARLRQADEKIRNIIQTIKEKEDAYNAEMQVYRDRMNELRNTDFADIVCTEDMSMKNLQEFCGKVMEGGYANKTRKLWAMKDGKLYYVKGLGVLGDGKAVFSIDDDSVIPPKP